MPGQLQEGFGCVVTNRFDQLLDDESDPFEILKAAETKKKEGAAAGSTKTAAQAAKQPKKESQKDRKNPLLDKKEESQAPVPLKKEGKPPSLPPTCLPARAPWMFIFTFPLSCAASGANVSCCLSERMIMCSGAPRLARQQKVVRTQGRGRDVATSSIRREGVWCRCWAVCCWRLLRAASTQLSTGDAQTSLKQVPVVTLS